VLTQFLSDEREDVIDDGVDRHPGRVDACGAWRERERGCGARFVGQIARLDCFSDSGLTGLAPGVRRVVRTATGTLFGRGIKIDLHISVRKDNASDVTSFHDDTAVLPHCPLTRHEYLANLWQLRHCGCEFIDFRSPNRSRDVVTIDRDDTPFHHEICGSSQLRNRRFVVQRNVIVMGLPTDRSVHRTGIDVSIP
jgi:hypothetical protein